MDAELEFLLNFCVWIHVAVSCYLALANFVYFIQEGNNERKTENFIVFLAVLICVSCSILFFAVDFQHEVLKYLCNTSPTVYKSSVVFSKCLCNIIFVKRYKAIKRRSSTFSVKRAYCFSFCIIAISLILLTFDQILFYLFNKTSFLDCFPLEELRLNLYQISVVLGYFLITTVLQTVILVEIIKPLCRHVEQINNSYITNESIKRTLNRIVVCTFIFSLSDFGLVILQFIMTYTFRTPMPIFAILNLIINAISLICSYSDYRKRLFPFSKYCIVQNIVTQLRSQSLNTQNNDERNIRMIRNIVTVASVPSQNSPGERT